MSVQAIAALNPTTAAPYRQAPDRRRLPPEQPPREGDHPWLT
jgi:hypothetical protein